MVLLEICFWKDVLFALVITIPLCVSYTLAYIKLVHLAKDEVDLVKSGFVLAFSLKFDDHTLNKLFNSWFEDIDIINFFSTF